MTRRAMLSMPLAVAAGRGIRIEPDGMPAIAGKREFILGLYQLPKIPDAWKAAREAGFQLVHTRADAGELDAAREHGMYAWLTTGAAEDRIRKTVAIGKDHPALLFWETEDEPSFAWKKPRELRTPPEKIIAAYALIKQLDPAHPVYLNHAPTNLEATLRRYNPGCDIVATDIYPVVPHGIRELFALWPDGRQGDFLNTSVSQVGQYTDKMRRVAGSRRALFMVLQAFAWETLRKQDQDPRMILYPTRAQTRFMAYQAIVHGANGLLWWGISYAPGDAPMWTDLCAVVRELAEMRRELALPRRPLALQIKYHDTGHSLDRGIEYIAKGPLLILVNADGNPVEATVGGIGRLEFEPFGVHIRRI